MKVVRSIFAAIVSAGVFTATLTAPPAVAQAAKITWEDCPNTEGRPGAQCGRIDVPKEYSNPNGEKISVGFIYHKATQGAKDTIFVNPGGPGGSAYSMIDDPEIFPLPDELFANYDVVGVQPRGLPGSTPLYCLEHQNSQDPVTGIFQAGKVMRDSCEAAHPGLANSLTTENTARDWEEVRKALAKDHISILGLSYGTILGSTYATLFPAQTNRVVLDSGLDAESLWADIMSKQEAGYRNAMHDFFAWVAKNDDKYHLGTTPYAVYTKWAQRVQSEAGVWPPLAPPAATAADAPIQGSGQTGADAMNAVEPNRAQAQNLGEQLITGNNISQSVLYLLSYQMVPMPRSWEQLANAIISPEAVADIIAGNGEITDEAIKEAVTSMQMQQAMICNEAQVAPNRADFTRYLWNTLVTKDVFLNGATVIGSGANCEGAPPITKIPAFTGSELKVRPLQLQGTNDPQTPYGNFWNMQKQMNSHLITVHGPGHGHFGSGNAEVNKVVLNYFAGGTPEVTDLPGYFG